MPIQTRCPSCSAALPANAAWCSLCHADLRTPAPVTAVAVDPVGPNEPVDLDVELREAVEPSGRHAIEAPVTRDRVPSSGGKHAAGRRASSRPSPRSSGTRAAAPRTVPEDVLEGIDVPADATLTPEQVDALAAQMLQRLAVTEKSAGVLDPGDLPGGKWGFTAGLMALIVIVLITIGTVGGFLLSR